MAKCCKVISFGKINKKFFILMIIGTIIYALLDHLKTILKFSDENKHPIIFTISFSLAKCLFSIILFFFLKFKKNSAANINFTILEKKGRKLEVSKRQKFLWILLVSYINFTSNILYSIFCLDVNYLNDINTWLVDILSLALFSRFILKKKLYRHHFLSIIIFIPFIALDFTFDMMSYNGAFIRSLVNNLTHIIINLTYVLYKYFMLVKCINYYEILTYEGIIELFLGIVTIIITTYIGYIDNFLDFIYDIDKIQIIYLIIFIFLQFFYYLIIVKIIDIFTAFHTFLFSLFSELLFSFLNLILYNTISFSLLNKSIKKPLYAYILNVILISTCNFAIMVYLEWIELNFCNLSGKIKKNLEIRAQKEFKYEIGYSYSDDSISIKGYSLDVFKDEEEDEAVTFENDEIK